MGHQENEQEVALIPSNIIELNTRRVEVNRKMVKIKSRVPLRSYPLEISQPGEGEAVEVLVYSKVDLELHGQEVYPASTIYTDGNIEQIMPAFLTPFYRGYGSGSDQLVISGHATYMAWYTDHPSEEKYLPHDLQGRPFQHHLVTTLSMAKIRRSLGSGGNGIIKLVPSRYSSELRRSQYSRRS